MTHSPPTSTPRRLDPERGAALMVAVIATVALLGIGAVTLLSVRSDTQAASSERFQQQALYAAESGAAAGMDFIRNNCSPSTLYSGLVEPNNTNPQTPMAIPGNNQQPGDLGNPFTVPATWYRVSVLNNESDSGFAAGDDTDGIVRLRIEGRAPGGAVSTIEVEVQSPSCLAQFCASEYAQAYRNERNDTLAACSGAIDLAAGLRSIQTP
jgi:hypothetical protein